MTVKELINQLLNCDMDTEVEVYVSFQKKDIEESYQDCEKDTDWVVDDYIGIDEIDYGEHLFITDEKGNPTKYVRLRLKGMN